MPVFDFTSVPDQTECSGCTYTIFQSNESLISPDRPAVILDNHRKKWRHHSCGVFANPNKQTTFEFKEEDGTYSADILQIGARFASLLQWLGESHINVRLSGESRDEGYAVYKIYETTSGGRTKLSAEDGFLQFVIDRLLASSASTDEHKEGDLDETGDGMRFISLQSITGFTTCAGRTMPDNVRLQARGNFAVTHSYEVSPGKRRHAQRAPSIMMNIQWENNYFEAIDPQGACRILDRELYGMEHVKQRIIRTIIQINRTHTLSAYGLLLVGPAGTGKSQIAYAVARILKFPRTILGMSSINDPEQLAGSSRIYANAKPGIITEVLSMAGESSLVFIANGLDKAAAGEDSGNPAGVLLTLLDNLGFMDDYIECMIPTVGVHPVATADDKTQISTPLMSRSAVIDIPDHTREEEKIIFSQYAFPEILKRMSMNANRCIVTEEALYAVIERYSNTIRVHDLKQAVEHIAANALYQVGVDHIFQVTFSTEMVKKLLG